MVEHIHIIGCGAIGSLLAAKAQLNKYPVVRHIRSEPVTSVRLVDQQIVHLNTLQNCWPASSKGQNLIILPLKSYQVAAAIAQYVEYFPPNSGIVLLHNGMGCYESVANALTPYPVYLATTSVAAFKPSVTHCIHTGDGKTQLGAAGHTKNKAMQQSILSCFQSLLPSVQWQADVHRALWQKLAVNSLINPLTAIHNIANGQLLEPQYTEQLAGLAGEIADVTKAENLYLSKSEVLTTTFDVIRKTANNYSSMQQDVKHKKTTEIDSINGFLLDCAKKHGINCPYHQAVYQGIKAISC